MLAIYKRLPVATLIAMLFKPTGKYSLDEVLAEVNKLYEAEFFRYDELNKQFVVRFTLEDDIQAELDVYQYQLPLIVSPKYLKHNMSSGYYEVEKQSVVLNKRRTNKDINLNHLNLINHVAFSINETVLKKAKNVWKANSDETVRQIARFNKFCKVAQKLMLENGNKFFFSHRYDYRGRTYCEGYYLNYQGNDYCKSLIEFNHKEIID